MLTIDAKDLEEQLLSLVVELTERFEKGVELFARDSAYLFINDTPYGDVEKYLDLYIRRYEQYGFEIEPGLAKGSWVVSTGNLYSLGPLAYDKKNGYYSKIRAQQTVQEYQLGEDIYITNSVPYIGKLNEGSSKQLPEGFKPTVDQVVALYDTNWKKYFKKVKKNK